jgi:hypothetical protein
MVSEKVFGSLVILLILSLSLQPRHITYNHPRGNYALRYHPCGHYVKPTPTTTVPLVNLQPPLRRRGQGVKPTVAL